MQRTASETMNQPGSQSSGEPPSAGKAVARPGWSPGKKCWWSAAPSWGGPYRRHEVQGRTWANDCPGPAILPAPAAGQW